MTRGAGGDHSRCCLAADTVLGRRLGRASFFRDLTVSVWLGNPCKREGLQQPKQLGTNCSLLLRLLLRFPPPSVSPQQETDEPLLVPRPGQARLLFQGILHGAGLADSRSTENTHTHALMQAGLSGHRSPGELNVPFFPFSTPGKIIARAVMWRWRMRQAEPSGEGHRTSLFSFLSSRCQVCPPGLPTWAVWPLFHLATTCQFSPLSLLGLPLCLGIFGNPRSRDWPTACVGRRDFFPAFLRRVTINVVYMSRLTMNPIPFSKWFFSMKKLGGSSVSPDFSRWCNPHPGCAAVVLFQASTGSCKRRLWLLLRTIPVPCRPTFLHVASDLRGRLG